MKNYIFIDTNIFCSYVETPIIREELDRILKTDSIFLTTDIVVNELKLWAEKFKLLENQVYKKIILTIKKRFTFIKLTKKNCTDSWVRDYLNFPPHRMQMSKPTYSNNHRDTVNWLALIDYLKKNAEVKSLLTFYTNDSDFITYQDWLIQDMNDEITIDIKFKSIKTYQIYAEWISKPDYYRFNSWEINCDWFNLFSLNMDKKKNGLPEWLVETLLFISTKKHPVKYILQEYSASHRCSHSENEYIINFYKKLIIEKEETIKKIINKPKNKQKNYKAEFENLKSIIMTEIKK